MTADRFSPGTVVHQSRRASSSSSIIRQELTLLCEVAHPSCPGHGTARAHPVLWTNPSASRSLSASPFAPIITNWTHIAFS